MTMEWTYHITQPFTVNRHSLYPEHAPPLVGIDNMIFSPGEIDASLYRSLVKGNPNHVIRTPKNELLAAVYAARGVR